MDLYSKNIELRNKLEALGENAVDAYSIDYSKYELNENFKIIGKKLFLADEIPVKVNKMNNFWMNSIN